MSSGVLMTEEDQAIEGMAKTWRYRSSVAHGGMGISIEDLRIDVNRLHGMPDGYSSSDVAARLFFQVADQKITVAGAAVDKPDRDQVYRKATERLSLRQICQPTQKSPAAYSATGLFLCNGGEIGIRTLGTGEGTTDFESVPFGHSGISPTARIITVCFAEANPKSDFFPCYQMLASIKAVRRDDWRLLRKLR